MPEVHINRAPECDTTLGATCVDKSIPGVTVWRMRADNRFGNQVGVVQGGFLSALADCAMGSASVTYAHEQGRKVHSSTIEMKISFLAPARLGTSLECTARVVRGGRRVAFVEAEIVDDTGITLARTSSSLLLTERGH